MERNEVVVLDFFDTQKEEEKDTRLSLFFGLKIDFFIYLYSSSSIRNLGTVVLPEETVSETNDERVLDRREERM